MYIVHDCQNDEHPTHIGNDFEKYLNDWGINLAIQDSTFVKLIWIHGLTFGCFCGLWKGAEHKLFFAL